MKENRPDGYRRFEICRPQYPMILRWVDPEFEAIYINKSAAADANIICLIVEYEEEGEG